LPNGEIITHAIRKEVQIILPDGLGGGKTGSFEVKTISETPVQFRSKAVVISHGGRQEIHRDFYNWFPCMKDRKDRVMLADNLLRRATFKNVIKDLNSKNVKNFVIIGGSHSGFSAAWMLMNGPADVLRNSHVKPSCQI